MKLWMVVMVLIVSPVSTLDPCKQPIGMENGLIKDDQIKLFDADDSDKTSVRLQSTTTPCNNITGVEVNLGRFMTITGFAFQSDKNIDGIVVRYGVNGDYDSVWWQKKYKFNLIMQDKDNREARTFNYTKTDEEVEQIMFEDHPFSLLYIKIELPSKSCFKFELFGCADICSSPLNSPSLFQLNEMVNDDWLISWCPINENTTDVKMTKLVTFTGLIIHNIDASKHVDLTVTCMNDSSDVKQYTIEQKTSQQSIAFWFDEQHICDEISLTSSSMTHCVNISLIGCESDCMSRLDIGSAYRARNDDSFDAVVMKASSWISAPVPNNDTTKDPIDIYHEKPIEAFLYNIGGSWLANQTDTNPWIQVCFKKTVLVSGVAIQSQGFFGYGRIISYVLGYSYDDSRTNVFPYRNNTISEKFSGPMSRFQTQFNPLHTPVTAKCFELRQLNFTQRCAIRFELLGCNKTTVKPSVTIETQQTIGSGLGKTITCSIYGQPGTSLQWKNISGIIKNNSYYSISTNVNNISDLNVSYSFTLQMMKEMREYWGRSELNCNHGDNGEKIINCSSVFTCTAFYVEDEKVEAQTNVIFQFNRTVGRPSVITMTTTNSSVTISWNSSFSNGDFPVVGYQISLEEDGNNLETSQLQSKTFKELKPFTNYTAMLLAYNQFKISSETVRAKFQTNEAAPLAIMNLNTTVLSSVRVYISWNEPSEKNGILSFYFIQWKRFDQKEWNEAKTLNTTFSISDLEGLATYNITVKASTNEGNLIGPSVETYFTTKEGKPTAPQLLNALINEKLKITWKEPQNMNGILKCYRMFVSGKKDFYPQFTYNNMTETKTMSIQLTYSPGATYTINVQAETGGGVGPNATYRITSPYGKPEKAIIAASSKSMKGQTVTLTAIEQITGPISYYELSVSNFTDKDCFESSHIRKNIIMSNSTDVKISKGKEIVKIGEKISFKLQLIGVYRFCLRAVVNGSINGDSVEMKIERTDLSPPSIVLLEGIMKMSIPKGPIDTRFYVIVVKMNSSNDLTNLRGYDEENPTKSYITAVFKTYVEQFIVGDGKTYSYSNQRKRSVRSLERYQNVKNVELKENTKYSISVRAHVNESKFYDSPWIYTTTKTSLPIDKDVQSGEDDESNSTTIAVSVSVAVIIISIVLVVGFIMIRRRRNNATNQKENSVKFSSVGQENPGVDVIEQVEEKREEKIETSPKVEISPLKKQPPTKVLSTDSHPPIKLSDLHKKYERLMKDSHHALSEEYRALDSGQLHEWTDAIAPQLKSKNRYGNIVTYNHSRVKLQPTNGSDYINATYIHGYSRKNMYIGSQGPNAASLNDFWQMIWEQNISVIVMATKLVENVKRKCEQYWPDDGTKTYGTLSVSANTENIYADFVIRTFSMNKIGETETRYLHHYHFTSWPDHGVPEFPCDLLNFHNKVRRNHPVDSHQSPMLVHCSAGVGRTGTFICIDNMLKLAKEREVVDVFNYVNFMRSRRIHMVQTEDQYLFIYRALFEAITCGVTVIEISQFNQENRRLLERKDKGKTGYQIQFDTLNSIRKELSNEETSTARKASNISKNRTKIHPRNNSRVFLTSSIYDNQNTEDYINAVYVNAYRKKNAFIATHHPLESTVYEFWKMILEKKVVTVVMLHSLHEDKTLEVFWPESNATCNYADVTITSDEQITNGDFTKMTFKATLNSHMKDEIETTFIWYHGWPVNDEPKKSYDLIQLLTQVDECKKHNVDSPVVVMCSDGAGRSGTFIAISILMEQLKVEQTVDVFQTVKKIRNIRPEFVQNIKQYQVCYSIIQQYLDSISVYSNLSG